MGRRSNTREKILANAMELMRDKGYSSVGVDDILRAAGAGKSSFYHFFESKEVLGVAVIEAYARMADEGILRKAFLDEDEPLKRPLRFAELLTTDGEPLEGVFAGLYPSDRGSVSEPIRERSAAMVNRVAERFETAFYDAVDGMELHPDTPVPEIAMGCVAYIHGLLLTAKLTGDESLVETLGPQVSNLWSKYKL